MADSVEWDPVIEEFISGLTKDSTAALGKLLSATGWDDIRDDLFCRIDHLSSLDQLRHALLMIRASVMQNAFNHQTCYDTYEYISLGSIWEAVEDVIEWEECNKLVGMPEAVDVAEKGIQLNWGVEAYDGFPEEWFLAPSGFMTCLLYRLSCVVDQNEATELLRSQRPTISDVPWTVRVQDVATVLQTEFTTNNVILDEIRTATDCMMAGLQLLDLTRLELQSDQDGEGSEWELDNEGLQMEYPCFWNEADYDGQSILDSQYLNHNGWAILRGDNVTLVHLDGVNSSIEEINSFIQHWLIFGTMNEIFGCAGITLQKTDFIRTQENTRYISFIQLDRYILDFARKMIAAEAHTRNTAHQTMLDCLSLMEEFSLVTPIANVDEDLLSSIQQLCECLSAVFEAVFQDSKGTGPAAIFEQALARCHFDIPSTKLPKGAVDFPHSEWYIVGYESMRENGWCPRDINMLLNEPILCGDEYTYFASTLDRRIAGRGHTKCNKDECRSRKLDKQNYKPWHYRDCVDCPLVTVDINKVTKMLKTGQYPLISIDTVSSAQTENNQTPDCSLSVTANEPYVAISHVWSDGLGNVNENGLPTCQLLRIMEQANALFDSHKNSDGKSISPSIWIDTLCVPLEREARKLALRQLGKAYLEAEYVLVLDEELQNVTLKSSHEEKLTRILLSEWMHRLWTMEEACFGVSKLRFQFRDGIYALPDLQAYESYFRRLNLENLLNSPKLLYNISVTLIDRLPFQSKYRLEDKKDEAVNLFATYAGSNPLKVLEGVQHRSTSKEEDEFLCISSIMGLDVARVAQFNSSADRAKTFYQMLMEHHVSISPQILFSAEPKLKAQGFGWAPSSLSTLQRYQHHAFFYEQIDDGRYADSRGLYCHFPAYLLDVKSRNPQDKWLVTQHEGERKVWQTYLANDVPTINKLERKPPLWSATSSEVGIENERLAIVLNLSSEGDSPSKYVATGILVRIYGEDYVAQDRRKVTFAHRLLALWSVETDHDLEEHYSLAEATWTRPMDWCIG